MTVPLCDRVTCDRQASVCLLFDPRLSAAWLRDLDPTSRLVGIALCIEHANKVTTPAGWSLADERSGTNRVAGSADASSVALAEAMSVDAPVRLVSVSTVGEAAASGGSPRPAAKDAKVDPAEAADADSDPGSDDDDVDPPTLWDDDEPEGLRVDSSTPLLSRAFRAAHID